MKTAIINNKGVGNGVIVYPMIKNLENDNEIIHMDNLFLKNHNSELENLVGFFPDSWRRFKDVEKMISHFKKEGVDQIINIRKEAKEYDLNYFKFKEVAENYFKIFDIYAENINNSDPIGFQCKQVFENAFGNYKNFDWKFLNDKYLTNSNILLYIGSNIPGKSLKNGQVKKLHESIREINYNSNILICAGNGNYEKEKIKSISEIIDDKKTKFINFNNLNQAENTLLKYATVLTVDTYFSHLSGASSNDTYTIFLRTNGDIWRNSTQPIEKIFQSYIPMDCDRMKNDGTCLGYYTNCNDCTGEDLNFKQIGYIIGQNSLERISNDKSLLIRS